MQKKCLCSFNRRPKMQKNAFVHLVEAPKCKKTTFFIITNLPPQPFSSKYQMIFRCLKRFPANIKRYLSPARRTKACPQRLDRGRRAPRDPREEIHLVKRNSRFEKKYLRVFGGILYIISKNGRMGLQKFWESLAKWMGKRKKFLAVR